MSNVELYAPACHAAAISLIGAAAVAAIDEDCCNADEAVEAVDSEASAFRDADPSGYRAWCAARDAWMD